MSPDASFILKKTKLLLESRYSQFVIRLLIYLLENSDDKEKKCLRLKSKSLSRAHKGDIKELIAISEHSICLTRLDHNNPTHDIFEFECAPYSCRVEIPLSFGKKGDVVLDDKIKKVWENYETTVGQDRNVWKTTPSLTTSKNGRYGVLKRFLTQNPDFEVEHCWLVIKGVLRSPYHMGFNPKTGEKLPKHYCDIPNIFANRQRAEELMSKCDSEHYLSQIERLAKKNNKQKNIDLLKSQANKPSSTTELSDDEWLGL
ncbi:hypothetical protein [Photobacterium damselae]|uniref:hypothetical protein n=1 Tax=Photobacterium damselae TaxID=38293 RepID=UPI001F1D6A14|nr:hypothetical protein [Photobacterium damselae]UKA04712.1 hypothetical protein IHC89_20955 [Photobacterium damselae subsp. damselae]